LLRSTAVAALLAFGPPLLPAAQQQGGLRDEEMIQRCAAEVRSFADARAVLDVERKALAASESSLLKARTTLQEPLPAPPPAPSAIEALLPEEVAGLVQLHAEHAAARQQRQKDVAAALALFDAHRIRLKEAQAKLAVVDQSAGRLAPLLAELETRVAEGRLAGEKVLLDERLPSLAVVRERLEAAARESEADRPRWEQAVQQLEADRRQFSDGEATDPAAVESQRRVAEEVAVLDLAVRLAAIEREESASSPEAVTPAALARLVEDESSARERWNDAREQDAEARARLEELDREAGAIAVPDKESISEGEGHAELRAARRNALYSDALIYFHERRAELLDRARSAAEALRQALLLAGDAADQALRQGVKLLVAREGSPGPREEVWRALRGFAAEEARRRAALAALETRLQNRAEQAALAERLDNERKENRRLRDVLGEEESYAGFLAEMAARSETELIQLLAPDGEIERSVRARAEAVAAAQQRWAAAEAKASSLRIALRAFENPYTEIGLRRGSARAVEIQQEIESLREAKLPVDRESAPLGVPVDENGSAPGPGAAAPAAEAVGEEEQKARCEREEAFAKDFVRYFQALESQLARGRESLAELDAAAADAAARHSDLLNEEKRRYACARELERRSERGRVGRSRLPDGLGRLATRDAIVAASRARDEWRQRHGVQRGRHEVELKRLETILGLKRWADLWAAAAARKTSLIGFPITHGAAARRKYDELTPVERKELDYRAEVLRRSEDGAFDALMASFTAPRDRERFEETLAAFYLELVMQERALAEFRRAIDAYEQLIQVAGEWRAGLAPAPVELRETEALRVLDYRAARYLAAIAAAPDQLSQLEARFRAEYKRDLPVPADPQGWSQRYWADQLFAAEGRLWGHRRWIAEFERLLSKLGVEAEIAHYRKAVVRLGSEVERAAGRSGSLAADVASLREAYARQRRADTIRTAGQVLVIPLLAWFLLRLLRRFARRIEARPLEGVTSEQSERLRRLRMLARVSSAAIGALVWSITGIYVLGRLGVDVTPILASAGVVGLAIAFGAQTLIRDYFAGFFILLENQFAVGDVVDAGVAKGVVERFSLRVTTLRDLEGTVHYLPNGTLNRISNLTQGWSRAVVEVGIGYHEDIDRATGVLKEMLTALTHEPPWKFWILEEPTVLGVEKLGDSSVTLRLTVKIRPGKQWEISRELRKRIKQAFDAHGIEIPFPQRVIHHVNVEAPGGAREVAP